MSYFTSGKRVAGWVFAVCILFYVWTWHAVTLARQAKRPFTVSDDIGFNHFVSGSDPYGSAFQIYAPAQFSPNGELLAVLTERPTHRDRSRRQNGKIQYHP